MEKRFNFRIYPNREQEIQIKKNFGCVRFIYNYYLNKRIEAHKEGKGILTVNECCRDLTTLKRTEGYEWLREADDNSLRNAIRELDLAYKSFFRNVRKGGTAPGHPKFKNRRQTRSSYRSKNNSRSCKTNVQSIESYVNQIKLPKLGLVKCRLSRKTEGRILSATVFQVPSGRYFVSVCCTEIEPQPLPRTGASVGIQMGVKTLAFTSDGQRFENRRFYEKSARKIARLQRAVSRKPKDSNNREKARLRLACAYERLYNQKTDTMQKATTRLVGEYDVICARDEQLMEMARNRRYARQLADAGWGAFSRQLEYKCDWYGKTFVKISHWHPSTQLCSSCGEKRQEIRTRKYLSTWDCPKCGASHNRGINAAINVLNEGTRTLTERHPESADISLIRLGKPKYTPAENVQDGLGRDIPRSRNPEQPGTPNSVF